jgi:O-antigen/teichoic acid export membrane protein
MTSAMLEMLSRSYTRLSRRVQNLLAPFPLLLRLTHAAGWTTLGTLIGNGLTFIAMICVARILGRDAFGEVGILQSTVAMFQVFAAVGLSTTAMKHVAEYRVKEPQRAGHIIAISDLTAMTAGGVAAVVVLSIAPWLAAKVLVRPAMTPLLRIAAVTIAVSSLNGAMNGTLGGMEEFRSIALINFLGGLTAFPLVLAGALWKGVEGVVAALAAQASLTCLLLSWMARRKAKKHGIPISLQGAGEWPVLWRFSLPAMLAGIAIAPAEWLCSAMLVRHSGYSQMGFYTAAMQWRNVLMFLPIMIVQSALPVFASVKSAHGEQSEEFNRLMVMSQSSIMLLIFPVATLLMFLSREIFRIYGAAYSPGSTVLIGVCFLVIVHCSACGLGPAVEAWGNMWVPAVFNFCWGLIYVLLVRLDVGRWGAPALPFSAGAASIALTYMNLVYFRGRFPRGTNKRITLAIVAAIAMAAGCLALPVKLRAWLALPCSFIILVLALFYFSDRELIAGKLIGSWGAFVEARSGRNKEVV